MVWYQPTIAAPRRVSLQIPYANICVSPLRAGAAFARATSCRRPVGERSHSGWKKQDKKRLRGVVCVRLPIIIAVRALPTEQAHASGL